MGGIVAIAEGEALDGLELCGVKVISVAAAEAAREVMTQLGEDVAVLIVTPAVASVVGDALDRRVLCAVVPE